jgi:hypothetical protein
MKKQYVPKRATKRWLNGAPDYILDCFFHPNFVDCYEVFFGKSESFHVKRDGTTASGPDQYHNTYINGISTSENGGVSGAFEMTAHEVAMYRYRNKHRKIAWQDLPDTTRQLIVNFVES